MSQNPDKGGYRPEFHTAASEELNRRQDKIAKLSFACGVLIGLFLDFLIVVGCGMYRLHYSLTFRSNFIPTTSSDSLAMRLPVFLVSLNTPCEDVRRIVYVDNMLPLLREYAVQDPIRYGEQLLVLYQEKACIEHINRFPNTHGCYAICGPRPDSSNFEH